MRLKCIFICFVALRCIPAIAEPTSERWGKTLSAFFNLSTPDELGRKVSILSKSKDPEIRGCVAALLEQYFYYINKTDRNNALKLLIRDSNPDVRYIAITACLGKGANVAFLENDLRALLARGKNGEIHDANLDLLISDTDHVLTEIGEAKALMRKK